MSYLVTTPLKLHKRGGDGGVLVVLVYQGGLPLDRCELEQHLAMMVMMFNLLLLLHITSLSSSIRR